MTDPGPLRRVVTVPLRPADAFDLFTAGIDGWWPRPPSRPGARMRLAPGRDGALSEEAPGRAPRVWARVTVWEPGRRLVLTWAEGHGEDEEPSEVEVRFTPVEAGTRVDVTHASLDALAEAPRWSAALGALRSQAERRASSSPSDKGRWSPMGKVTVSR